MITIQPALIVAAREGDRAALDAIVRAAQRPIYNLAMRMLADPGAAEDATHEVLIKIITGLGSLRDPGAAGGWALRIACRHLVDQRKRSRVEAMRLSFTGFAEDLDDGQAPIAEAGLTPVEEALALEQVKIGCTLALLTCLSRTLRIAYILGDIFELTESEAAQALEIAPSAFRQRLSRARRLVVQFTQRSCGIASPAARCACTRRVVPALRSGRITPGRTGPEGDGAFDMDSLEATVRHLESGRAAAAAIMRSNPDFDVKIASLVTSVLPPHC